MEEKQKYVGKTSHNVGSHHDVVFIRIEKGHIWKKNRDRNCKFI